MEQDKKANRKYKDSVFTALFSDKKNAIELYNAIEGKNYPLDVDIKINTLDDALFLDRINDISFIIDDKLVILIEQQASINMNMPLRLLLYVCKVYERIIATNELNVYRRGLIKIPRPEFICLYNGKDDFPDKKTLKLSDAFSEVDGHPQIELDLTVKVININKGKNEHMIKESKTLWDYVYFIERVRSNSENGLSLEASIDEALKNCMANGVLESFLKKYRSEVLNMLAKEFDMDLALRASRYDGVEEGLEKGIVLGLEDKERDIVIELIKQNVPDSFIIAVTKITDIKLEQYKSLLTKQPS